MRFFELLFHTLKLGPNCFDHAGAVFFDSPNIGRGGCGLGVMFGPDATNPCPMCTVLLDSLNGLAQFFQQRSNLVVIARAPIEKVQSFADSRGWKNLRMLSSQGNSFNPDYQSEAENGAQMPMANVFIKTNGKVHHFWAPELFYVPTDSDPRHMDLIFPLWNLLDFTPEGRGADWMPKVF